MSDYITRLINGKQVQLATLMTGACFLADNSILMKRSFLWDLLERVTERCVLTFSRWLEARVIISCTGGGYERRDTLCNSAELEFPISELFHDEFKFATGKY